MTNTMTWSFGTSTVNIEQILSQIAKKDNISDIHISWDEYICFRLSWEIKKMENLPKLTIEMVEFLLKQLLKWNTKAFEKFTADKELDFSYISDDGTPYRVNVYYKLSKPAIVLRKINSTAKNLEDIMFPELAESIKSRVLSRKQWLFLVTWPTGSWKSTSLVAMLNFLNQTRSEHIITIEDPVEFIFQAQKCIISQREVGHDTWAFRNALRAAMREDPDIILVWEIRDVETAEAVLNLAETWHMVFSTLHTSSASGTINRFISFFPPEIQDSIADRMAEVLIWVQSQRLTKRADTSWRVWLYEVLLNTSAVKNNIKKRQLPQIDNIIETWVKQGMIRLDQYAKRLIKDWIVTEESVSWIISQYSSWAVN